MQKIRKIFSVIVIVFVLVATILVNFSHHKWLNENVIENDVKSYYSYLPATFIYKDITLNFFDENPGIYDEMWPVNIPNGNKLIVTSYGLSLLYSPFFFTAHGYSLLNDKYEADGYSLPYQFALNFSSVFYLLLGLIFLRKVLLMFFEDWIVAFVLLAVTVGTNLAYYVTYEAAMSHSYSFALIAVFLYLVIKWYETPSRKKAIVVGALFGLIVLIRPTNLLVFFILFLWEVKSWSGFRERIAFYLKRFDYVLIMLFFFILVWCPQFFYWKTVTGDWIYFSYGAKDASFFWSNPQILNILFSYKKGWFVYTPIMLVAFIGIFLLKNSKLEGAFPAILVFSLLNIYVQSSWWSWWFGGGFSIRAFIDSYAVMAIPFGMVLKKASDQKILRFAVPVLLCILIWFNTFQLRQYNRGAIHFWWNTREAYWENFLKIRPTSRYYELVRIPDYYLARQGRYEAITPVEKRRRDLWRSYRDDYVDELRGNQIVIDSLNWFTSATEKTLDDALQELAAKKTKMVLQDDEAEIKERIRNDKEWDKFLTKQAKENNISYDSALSIEYTRIINSIYID